MEKPTSLRAYRAAENLTLDQLAIRFGVHKTTILRWEEGDISANRAVEVEQKTGIPRWRLRPDLWDAPEMATADVA